MTSSETQCYEILRNIWNGFDKQGFTSDLNQHSGAESDTSARTLLTRSTSTDTGSAGEHASDTEGDKRSSTRRTLQKRKRAEEGGRNDGDGNDNASPANADEPGTKVKQALFY